MYINEISTMRKNSLQKSNNVKNFKKFELSVDENSVCSANMSVVLGGLLSVGYADGSNVTIYKSDEYSESNPELKIVIKHPNGRKEEQYIDPRKINPSHATGNEILALHSYLMETGKLDVSSIYSGVTASGTMTSDVKLDFFNIIREMMMMQYNVHNILGYQNYNRVLDAYMSMCA